MLLDKIARSLAELDWEETVSLTDQAILAGERSDRIVLEGLMPGLGEVAKRYKQAGHLFPDIYKASIIYQDALAKIKHQIVSMETDPDIWGVIGVASGDTQDFGKNIVFMTLEANGFNVKDLGKSVGKEKFLNAAREGADFIAISVMTDKGLEEARRVVLELKEKGLREQLKVIVGGAGVDALKASSIVEADGYAEDADEVVEFLKILFHTSKGE